MCYPLFYYFTANTDSDHLHEWYNRTVVCHYSVHELVGQCSSNIHHISRDCRHTDDSNLHIIVHSQQHHHAPILLVLECGQEEEGIIGLWTQVCCVAIVTTQVYTTSNYSTIHTNCTCGAGLQVLTT